MKNLHYNAIFSIQSFCAVILIIHKSVDFKGVVYDRRPSTEF